MNIFHALFNTSVGKKVVMAITGLILFGFVIGHLIGNLQLFGPPEKINAYAHLLESLGPGLWVIRLFLLVTVVLHIWIAIKLTLENKAARPTGYVAEQTLRATYASRTMRVSGFIVLAFLIYHLLHFTVRIEGFGTYGMTTLADGTPVRDVYTMMVVGFQNPLVSLFYIIGVGLLSWHLSHGLVSMFQSIGLRSRTWENFLIKIALIVSVLYFVGNLAIPGAVMAGVIDIQNPELISAAAVQH